MESTLTHLEGSRSGARYEAEVLQRLDPLDGAPLLARYDLARAARTLNPTSLAQRPGPGMWRWGELLPVRDVANRVHLGEGATPLLAADRLGAALGLDRLLIKAEGLNPTGSFKARGMSAAVSRAKELGARALIAPSAGNAGGALAAYGAAAGLPVTVVMPADTPHANVVEAQMCGARVILVDGFISDCGRVAGALAEQAGAFDVSTLKEPYRVEGKKTMGLELVEQLSWGVPDVVVYPTGGGTGLVGMWKAFEELEQLGLLGGGRPRMVSVQAAGCAPIVRAFAEGSPTARPWEDPRTRASGLRVPSAVGDRLILSCLRDSEGTAVAVPEEEIDALQRLAGRRGVGYVSPETAAALAAVATLADDGWLAANDRVVVFDTGIGQKYPPPDLPSLPTVPPEAADDPDHIGRLLGRGLPSLRTSPGRSSPSQPDGGGGAVASTVTVPEGEDAESGTPGSLMPEARSLRARTAGSRRLQGLMARRVAERRMEAELQPPPDEPTLEQPAMTEEMQPGGQHRSGTGTVSDPLRITGVTPPRVPGAAQQAMRTTAVGPRVPGTGAAVVPAPAPQVPQVPVPAAAPEPAVSEPAAPEPAAPEPAAPEPAGPEPAGPEPAAPEPAVPEPAAPEQRVLPDVPAASSPSSVQVPVPTDPADGVAVDRAVDESVDLDEGQSDVAALPRPPHREIVVHPLPPPPRRA